MAFPNANTNFQRQITILSAPLTPGFRLLALDVANPNVGGIPAQAFTVAMATDSTFWQSDGTLPWKLVGAGTSGATLYPDDVFVTWGDGTAAEGGNATQGLEDAGGGFRYLKVVGDNFTGVGDNKRSIDFVVATGNANTTAAGTGGHDTGRLSVTTGDSDVTGVGATGGDTGFIVISSGEANADAVNSTSGTTGDVSVGTGPTIALAAGTTGGNTGDLVLSSGSTNANDATATGGTTGIALLTSGSAGATLGTSGASGQAGVFSGDSASGVTGNVGIRTGVAHTTSGNVDIGTGSSSDISGKVQIETGSGETTGDVIVLIPAAATVAQNGVVQRTVRGPGGLEAEDFLTCRGYVPPVALGTSDQRVGFIPQVFKFDLAGDSSASVPLSFAGVVFNVWIVKTGAVGALAAEFNVGIGPTAGLPGGVTPILLGGVGQSLAGTLEGALLTPAGFSTTPGDRAFATTDSLVVLTTGVTAGCEIYVMAYRTA